MTTITFFTCRCLEERCREPALSRTAAPGECSSLRPCQSSLVDAPRLLEESDILCSVITVAEIHAGMKPLEREKTTPSLESLHIVDLTVRTAEKAGQYKRSIRSQSLELDDCFIAAPAYEKNALLLTGNGKRYPMTDLDKKFVTF